MAKKAKKRKYSKSSGSDVKSEMRRYKKGTAKSGPKGKGGRVKSKKQAIAIGLSKARKKGKKVTEEKQKLSARIPNEMAPPGIARHHIDPEGFAERLWPMGLSRIQVSRCIDDPSASPIARTCMHPVLPFSSVSMGASGCFDGAVGLTAFTLKIHEIQKVTGRRRIAQRAVMRLEFDSV
jgi:uncharacterized protein DUF6496